MIFFEMTHKVQDCIECNANNINPFTATKITVNVQLWFFFTTTMIAVCAICCVQLTIMDLKM